MSGQPGKPCSQCGKRFFRRKAESNYGFTHRRYCSDSCMAKSLPRPTLNNIWDAYTRGIR